MPSLLEDLGGRDGIEIVVAGLYERLLADPDLRGYFDGASRLRLEARLVEFFCALLGDRPADWQGRDLHAVHVGLQLSDRHLDGFLRALAATLAAAGVAGGLAASVRRRFEPLRATIVARIGPS